MLKIDSFSDATLMALPSQTSKSQLAIALMEIGLFKLISVEAQSVWRLSQLLELPDSILRRALWQALNAGLVKYDGTMAEISPVGRMVLDQYDQNRF